MPNQDITNAKQNLKDEIDVKQDRVNGLDNVDQALTEIDEVGQSTVVGVSQLPDAVEVEIDLKIPAGKLGNQPVKDALAVLTDTASSTSGLEFNSTTEDLEGSWPVEI